MFYLILLVPSELNNAAQRLHPTEPIIRSDYSTVQSQPYRAPCECISGAAPNQYMFGMKLKYMLHFVASVNNHERGRL